MKKLYCCLIFVLCCPASSLIAQTWCCCNPGNSFSCVENTLAPGSDCDFWCETIVGTSNLGDAAGYGDAACTGSTCAMSLPVDLSVFGGEATKEGFVKLNWRTTTETNNKGFEIQRANSKLDWDAIYFQNGMGESQVEVQYDFIDRKPFYGINFYRIKQIDFDDSFEYSNIITVDIANTDGIATIFPTLTKDILNLVFNEKAETKTSITIFDLWGRKVYEDEIAKREIDVSRLRAGQYVILLSFNHRFTTHRFTKGD